MLSFLASLGLNVLYLISYFIVYLEEFAAAALLSLSYSKRRLYALRLAAGFVVGILLCVLFSCIEDITGNGTDPLGLSFRIISYTLLNLYCLAVLFFACRERPVQLVLCWSLSMALVELAGQSYAVLLSLFGIGITDQSISIFGSGSAVFADYLVMGAYHAAVFILFAVLFARKNKLTRDHSTTVSVTVLAFSIAVTVCVLSNFSRVYETESVALTAITRLFRILCALFVIFLSFDIFRENKLSRDLAVTEQLLRKEKQQYEVSKDSMEAMNRKVHDLKKHLNAIEDKLTEEEIRSLREAVAVYDSNIKTGNTVLDTVLYENQLFCEKNGIRLSCLADGSLLSFLSPTHLYSLFSNAISNAMEALLEVEDKERRLIDISVHPESGGTAIEISNYFIGPLVMKNGTPVSTKKDPNKHGYGIASMRYIVSEYGGTLEFTATEEDIFLLRILFPAERKKISEAA